MFKASKYYNAFKRWLYGDSIEDYCDFEWVKGADLILHVKAVKGCDAYEYQIFVKDFIPNKAVHIPFQYIRVMGEELENTEGQDLYNCLYWSKSEREGIKPDDIKHKQCFYTWNPYVVKNFLELYQIENIRYPKRLGELLQFCKKINLAKI